MHLKDKKLDNPVWYALTEVHAKFAIEYKGIKFYNPDYCPFGGCVDTDQMARSIDNYATLTNSFFIVGEQPSLSENVVLDKNLVCNQMVLNTPINLDINILIVELKTKQQQADLLELVLLVQPGYFKSKTIELGKYFGIYKQGKLVAAAGERMQMSDYTEVSAIVTHPSHRGRGYAKQLIIHTTRQIFNRNKTPFLHVVESNIGAIGLYKKLGFTTRRKISFWSLKAKIK